ncbi:hypothetical protein DRQ09_00935 [candidate division KSB1 bacterium]|nr:MAG: hypothetical protein DRQ09_00935 [candidate division KSB1 bacterium]
MKHSFGIFIDGLDLKVAHLVKRKGKIFIKDVFTSKLISRVEVEEEKTSENLDQSKEIFGDAQSMDDSGFQEITELEKPTNLSIILDSINHLPVKKGRFGVNIPESNVYFIQNGKFKNIKKKKIKYNFLREVNSNQKEPIEEDCFECIRKYDGSYLGIYCKGNNYILEQLEEINSYVSGKIKISLIEVNELALIGYARRCYRFQEDETGIIIYVGNDFARIIFIKGGELFHLGDVINEGVNDSSIKDTIYSKILLGLDEWGISGVNTILLAGESINIELKKYLEEKFGDSVVINYLEPEILDQSAVDQDKRFLISSYAIPISIAWKILEPENREFFKINFLPERIRRKQNALRIEWHGYLLLLFLMLMSLFILKKKVDANMTIRNLETNINSLQSEIEFENQIVDYVNNMVREIKLLEKKNSILDSLENSSIKYSDILENYSRNIQVLNSLWIEKFQGNSKNYSIEGKSLYRNRINLLAQKDSLTQIKNVKENKIRKLKIYEFEIFAKHR